MDVPFRDCSLCNNNDADVSFSVDGNVFSALVSFNNSNIEGLNKIYYIKSNDPNKAVTSGTGNLGYFLVFYGSHDGSKGATGDRVVGFIQFKSKDDLKNFSKLVTEKSNAEKYELFKAKYGKEYADKYFKNGNPKDIKFSDLKIHKREDKNPFRMIWEFITKGL